MQDEGSRSLLQLMVNEGLVPSPEEEEKRKNVIEKLRKIVMAWVKRVAWQRRLPKQEIAETSATILTYGSYGLGVHGSESDIDALCLGPYFATMAEDFFIVLYNMLKSRPEVSEIHCVKDAKVPLMRFKFDGISIDLPYAQLKVLAVPENVDIFDPFFLRDIDETGWKSLSGVRANKRIRQLVPNLEKFQSMLRCVKLWAKRRGVYGNLNGFLGGVHLAILAAFVCQFDPNASLSALISNFFKTFAFWPWPTPVVLQDGPLQPTLNPIETQFLMPIRLPCSPHEYCHSNITKSTFYKIRAEFLRGHNLTKDFRKSDFDWHNVLEPFPYAKRYTRFLKIFVSASKKDELGDWVGWIKSRFCCLLFKLEEVLGLYDPNPAEYIDVDVAEPHVVFYWGLQPGKTKVIDIESVREDFWRNITNDYQGPLGKMELSIVLPCQLPKCAQFDTLSRKGTKACWKMIDYNKQRIPIYSQHLPHYVVGYVSTNGDPEYPSAGGLSHNTERSWAEERDELKNLEVVEIPTVFLDEEYPNAERSWVKEVGEDYQPKNWTAVELPTIFKHPNAEKSWAQERGEDDQLKNLEVVEIPSVFLDEEYPNAGRNFVKEVGEDYQPKNWTAVKLPTVFKYPNK